MHPYPPPPGWQPYPYPPVPQRSQTPRTLGTLSIVFGALTGIMSLIQLAAGKQLTGMGKPPGHAGAWERYTDAVAGFTATSAVVYLIMSAALVWIGLGQRGYKRWAIRASIVWSVVGLLVLVGLTVAQLLIVHPAMQELLRQLGDTPFARTMSLTATVGMVVGLGSYVPYPIILLIAFRRPHNVAAMTEGDPPVPPATALR